MNFNNFASRRSNVIPLHPARSRLRRLLGVIADGWWWTKAHLIALLPDLLRRYLRYRALGFPRRSAWFNARNRIGAGRR
ncbi:MAG TPA: hypothetical protein VIH29_12000 [Gallionella sp.]